METCQSIPKILVVDDEPQILSVMARQLRGRYAVLAAGSGALGIEALAREPDIAVVVSDMRMPRMDGREFLAKAKVTAPNAVRLLLTGQCDMPDAIGAVNEGAIFRFLEKPCPPTLLLSMLADAAAQYRLIMAERELLELTLRGSVQALCDTFAMTNPAIFGAALRVKRLAGDIVARIGGVERWEVEVAAMLCHLGAMTLPAGVYERRALREHLSPAEREMVERVPAITEQLLAPIPRLEAVREIVRHCRSDRRKVSPIPPAAHVLRAALDFDDLAALGLTPRDALVRMRAGSDLYEAEVIDALAALYSSDDERIVGLSLVQLREGMILAADLFTWGGRLLVSRGQEVTPGMLRRLENFDSTIRHQVISVMADKSYVPLRIAP